jgi:large subunit ribosomal protein L5
MTSLQEKYNKTVVAEMKKQFGLANNLEVPKITKVVINVGTGKYIKDGNATTEIANALAQVTGQKAVVTKAKQSISGFKIREGLEIGMKVTLRGQRKWDFIEKMVGAALPRVRDFRGIKESAVDKGGNLNIGIREHLIFPEIIPEQVKNTFSFQVTVVTNANDREKGMALFRLLGFPIENK